MVKLKDHRGRVDVVCTIYMRDKAGKLKKDCEEFREWSTAVRFMEDFNEPEGWQLERIVLDKDIKLW